jgi:hypothetical protein
MLRVRVSRKLRRALKELTKRASYSPEEFVPERILDRWYKEYVEGLRGYSETPGEQDSDKFYDWIHERKNRQVAGYAEDKVVELIEALP